MSRAIALLFAPWFAIACVEVNPPPCTSAGECLDGFECVDKLCLACVPGGCGGYQALSVGPGGGKVCSDDMGCVSVPSGALFEGSTIWARRAAVQATTLVSARSAIYSFGPADTVFANPVEIEIAISTTASTAGLRLFRLTGEGPVDLMGEISDGRARGKSPGLGLFVAGRATN